MKIGSPQCSDLKTALDNYNKTKVTQVVGKGDAATSGANLERHHHAEHG